MVAGTAPTKGGLSILAQRSKVFLTGASASTASTTSPTARTRSNEAFNLPPCKPPLPGWKVESEPKTRTDLVGSRPTTRLTSDQGLPIHITEDSITGPAE